MCARLVLVPVLIIKQKDYLPDSLRGISQIIPKVVEAVCLRYWRSKVPIFASARFWT